MNHPEPITDATLAAIARRANNAVPGPWTWGQRGVTMDANYWDFRTENIPGIRFTVYEYDRGTSTIELIGHARTDIPLLLAEIARLKGHTQ